MKKLSGTYVQGLRYAQLGKETAWLVENSGKSCVDCTICKVETNAAIRLYTLVCCGSTCCSSRLCCLTTTLEEGVSDSLIFWVKGPSPKIVKQTGQASTGCSGAACCSDDKCEETSKLSLTALKKTEKDETAGSIKTEQTCSDFKSSCCSSKSTPTPSKCCSPQRIGTKTKPASETCVSNCCSPNSKEKAKPLTCGSTKSGCSSASTSKCCSSQRGKIKPSCCSTSSSTSTGALYSISADEERPYSEVVSSLEPLCLSFDEKTELLDNSTRKEEGQTVILSVGGMTCAGCAKRIEDHFSRKEFAERGVVSVQVGLLIHKATIKLANDVTMNTHDICNELNKLGFDSSVISVQKNTDGSDGYPVDRFQRLCVRLSEPVLSLSEVEVIFSNIEGIGKDNVELYLLEVVEEGNKYQELHAQYEVVDPHLGRRNIFEALQHQLSLLYPEIHVRFVPAKELSARNSVTKSVRIWLYRLAFCVLFAAPVFILATLLPSIGVTALHSLYLIRSVSFVTILKLVFTTPIQLWIGFPIYKSAWSALRYNRRLTMDTLITLSTHTAYWYSLGSVIWNLLFPHADAKEFFEVSAYLVTLILVGRCMEMISKAKTTDVLGTLLDMQSPLAILVMEPHSKDPVIESCFETKEQESEAEERLSLEERSIDIEMVQTGDLLKVYPGSVVPIDGIVVYGKTEINESMITGETLPVEKKPGDIVIGGTVNKFGICYIRATHTAESGTLSNVCRLVEEAQLEKTSAQRIADRAAYYFVPGIIIGAAITFFVWLLLAEMNLVNTGDHNSFTFALMFGITVLVISCPCALSLAVPTPIMVATGVAAQLGILIKSGVTLEIAHKTGAVIFDKTGTLTHGVFKVIGVELASGASISEEDFFFYAGSAEAESEHYLGKAISKYAKTVLEKNLSKETANASLSIPTQFEAFPGNGVLATVNDVPVAVGSLKWISSSMDMPLTDAALNHIVETPSISEELMKRAYQWGNNGCTIVGVVIEGVLCGIIGLQDSPKSEASAVVQALHSCDIDVYMLSGDSKRAAQAIGKQIGIPKERIIAEATPASKAQQVNQIRANMRSSKKGRTNVVMVGDGINDSVALVNADVGISVGAGTDTAIEAADVVLIKDYLWGVFVLLDLAHSTYRHIGFNLAWAVGYNFVGIPFAAGFFFPLGIVVPPALAGLSEVISSLPVVLFSLLLNRYKPPKMPTNLVDGHLV